MPQDCEQLPRDFASSLTLNKRTNQTKHTAHSNQQLELMIDVAFQIEKYVQTLLHSANDWLNQTQTHTHNHKLEHKWYVKVGRLPARNSHTEFDCCKRLLHVNFYIYIYIYYSTLYMGISWNRTISSRDYFGSLCWTAGKHASRTPMFSWPLIEAEATRSPPLVENWLQPVGLL